MRVLVISDSISRARRIADLLAQDARLDVLPALSTAQSLDGVGLFEDVVVTAGLTEDRIPAMAPAIVALLNDTESFGWGSNIRAWLPMNTPGPEIVAAVIAAANHLTVLTPAQARRWLPSANAQHALEEDVPSESLTPREQQVLRLVADGFGNKEIAAKLEISDRTVKFHMAQILAKFGAASRAEAVSIGIRRGLVPL